MPAGNPNWKKGAPSGNPSGKRTGLIVRIREIIDANARELGGEGAAQAEIRIMQMAARGLMDDPHNPGGFTRVDSKTRALCAQWVAESYHGKPKQSVDVDLSGAIEHRALVDLGKLAHDELGTLERLLEKSALAEGLTDLQDAELVPPVPRELPIISDARPTAPGANGK